MFQYKGEGKIPGLWWPLDSSSCIWVSSPGMGVAGTGRGTSSSESPYDVTSAFWRQRQKSLDGHLCLITIYPTHTHYSSFPRNQKQGVGLRQRTGTLPLLRSGGTRLSTASSCLASPQSLSQCMCH